jgi:hypothetical protein
MSYTWRLESSAGDEVTPEGFAREVFPTQSDAESWLGETWRELLDAGVDQVSLLEGDRVVYGAMSLHPAQ